MSDAVRQVLNEIGYDSLQDCQKYWRCAAIYRNGDNKTSLCIDKLTGIWYDFVEGIGGSLKELVRLTTNENIDVQQLLEEIENKQNDEEGEWHKLPVMKGMKKWDHSELSKLLPHYKFYEDRGISAKTLSFFKSGLQHEGPLYLRYVFPIFDKNGDIIGWSGRDITDAYKSNNIKWKHLGSKQQWVYPVYVGFKGGRSKCLDAIKEHSLIIIVESIGDMLALWERGYHNTLVTFGLKLSPKMLSFIVGLNCDVCIATNNDSDKEENRGLHAAYDIFLKCMDYISDSKLHICPPTKNDFGDMDEDEILDWHTSVVNLIHRQDKRATYEGILSYLREKYKRQSPSGKRKITQKEIQKGKKIKVMLENYE